MINQQRLSNRLGRRTKKMDLKHLKLYVDEAIRVLPEHEDAEDVPVLITLSESSMGAGASVEVSYAGMSIDWEHGQFRIEPKEKICRLGKSYQDGMLMHITECEGRKYYFCPRCHERVKKNDNFCSNCGQAVILIK
jgi:hypothetical protein